MTEASNICIAQPTRLAGVLLGRPEPGEERVAGVVLDLRAAWFLQIYTEIHIILLTIIIIIIVMIMIIIIIIIMIT